MLLMSAVFALPAHAGTWGARNTGAWSDAPVIAPADKDLSVEAPIVSGDLTVYPVVDTRTVGWGGERTVTLASAMTAGDVQIGESGEVDALVMINRGERPVSVSGGDLVAGGHQDRLITHDVVLEPGRPVAVRVRCIESGRWSGGVEGFVYAGRADRALVQAARQSQDAAWSVVAQRNARRGRVASSSFVGVLDARQRAELRSIDRALTARTDGKQLVGLIVTRRGQPVTREVYADAASFASRRTEVLAAHVRAASEATWTVPVASDAVAWAD